MQIHHCGHILSVLRLQSQNISRHINTNVQVCPWVHRPSAHLGDGYHSRMACLPQIAFFATFIPLSKGHLPPTLFRHGKMKCTPPVHGEMMPLPRPQNEKF